MIDHTIKNKSKKQPVGTRLTKKDEELAQRWDDLVEREKEAQPQAGKEDHSNYFGNMPDPYDDWKGPR